MENKNKNELKSKKSSERSVAYPSVNLETAIELITKLRSALGKTPYSREEAAKAIGYSGISGASARTVAALTHYGLLDRSGNTYSINELAEEIIHPTDETGELRKQAIIKAARGPKLFESLIVKFQNQSLPTLLENILMREGVSSGAAKEVASIFKETLQYAGILVNGVVKVESAENISEMSTKSPSLQTPFAPFAPFDFGFQNKKQTNKEPYIRNESGHGWTLTIKTDAPFNSEIKKKLIDVSELLDQINVSKE